jgi:hypothetical protein
MPLRRRFNAFIARCHALIGSVRDPYQPELHARARPPELWYAKHVLGTGSNARSPSGRQQLVEPKKARLKAGLFVHWRLS